MKLSILIDKLPEGIRTQLSGNPDPEFDFYQVIISEQELFSYDQKILFICNYSEKADHVFKGNAFLINTPDDVHNGQNLYLHDTYNPWEIYLLILGIQKEYQTYLQQKEMLTNMISTSTHIQNILDQAYTYLQNPIIMINVAYEIVAASPGMPNGPSIEVQNGHHMLKQSALKSINEENISQLLKEKRGAFSVYSEKRETEMIYCAIWINRYMPYYLYLKKENREFSRFDLDYVTFLGKILQIELQKAENIHTFPRRIQGLFLKRLLTGEIQNITEIHEQLHSFGCETKGNYAVLILSINDITDTSAPPAYIKQLTEMISGCVCSHHENHIVCLLTRSMSSKETIRIINFINYNKCAAAVSPVFDDILLIRQHYQLTRLLLERSVDESGEYSIVNGSDYISEMLFSSCQKVTSLSCLIHPDIQLLIRYDGQYNTEYFPTLDAWLSNMKNQHKAAEAMHVHKGTISYRLQKIEDLLNIRLTDSDLLFTYELSCRIVHFINKK